MGEEVCSERRRTTTSLARNHNALEHPLFSSKVVGGYTGVSDTTDFNLKTGFDLEQQIMTRTKISKDEALSFLLTYIVVEQSTELQVDQFMLFNLNSLAQQASELINSEDGIIAHEVIEELAHQFLDSK